MKNESQKDILCPCGTGNSYEACCKPFHQGQLPQNALQLMRSRYSAYALGYPAYIIATTHAANPQFDYNKARWAQKISEHYSHTEFQKLDILDFQEGRNSATVTFTAHLSQDQKDISFTEKSYFKKVNGKWLYHSGEFTL